MVTGRTPSMKRAAVLDPRKSTARPRVKIELCLQGQLAERVTVPVNFGEERVVAPASPVGAPHLEPTVSQVAGPISEARR